MNWREKFFLCQGVRRAQCGDIITDEQRRERKNLAAIFIPYLLDAELEHTFAQIPKRLAPRQGVL